MFIKYMHIEAFGKDEVEGIEKGKVWVFPKLDGTNASVWWEDGLKAGSRRRELTPVADNAGFLAAMLGDSALQKFLKQNSQYVLYGEWLVPHSLKTYADDAWNKFYIFDVYCKQTDAYLPYEAYQPMLDEAGLTYVPYIGTFRNGTLPDFERAMQSNMYLIADGKGIGEGIVLKNYDYVNKFGRTVWAKLISNTFKDKHLSKFSAPLVSNGPCLEEKFVQKACTEHLISKVYAKLKLEGFTNAKIPQLLYTVYYDVITEELWDFLKKNKSAKLDFGVVQSMVNAKVKECLPEVFGYR